MWIVNVFTPFSYAFETWDYLFVDDSAVVEDSETIEEDDQEASDSEDENMEESEDST